MEKKVAVPNREPEDVREVLTARHVPIAVPANIVVPVALVAYVVRKNLRVRNHWGVQQKALRVKVRIAVSAGPLQKKEPAAAGTPAPRDIAGNMAGELTTKHGSIFLNSVLCY